MITTRTITFPCRDGAHDRCGGWVIDYGMAYASSGGTPPVRCDCDCGHLHFYGEADPETAPHDYGACDDCGGSCPQDDLTAIAGKRLCVTCADRCGR